MSEVLVLSHAEVERLLPMDECIEVMAEALADLAHGRVHNPLRFPVRPPEASNLLGLMPAYREPTWALKEVVVAPQNSTRGLDPHQGAVLLHDGETGELLAVLNASAITAVRTAAVTAVASRAFARENSHELAILGSGIQARSHLEALGLVHQFTSGRVWSRTPEHAQRFAAEADAPFPVEPVGSAEEAIRGADVVVTTTAAAEPVVEREWLAEGAHVNAVGSSIPTARELDTATIAAASLFVDRRESTLNEAGDYLFAAEEVAIGPEHILADLGEVLTGVHPGRTADDELTVFKSLGLAVEDLAAAEHVYRRARETGAGTAVPF